MTDIERQLKNVDDALSAVESADISEFMANVAKAEAAMNRLQEDHDRVAPVHDLDDAEVAMVKEELRKAGFNPDAMEDAK